MAMINLLTEIQSAGFSLLKNTNGNKTRFLQLHTDQNIPSKDRVLYLAKMLYFC